MEEQKEANKGDHLIAGMNIFEKMLCISNELKVVAKNLNVNDKYRAVGESDVIAAAKAGEVKYGIYSYPYSREIVDEGEITKTDKQFDRATGQPYDKVQTSRYLRLKTTYRFVNVNNPTEYIDMVTYADGIDPSDKAPGKAETYCDKYALMKAYKMITGDDPDQWSSVDTEFSERRPVANPVVPSLIEPAKQAPTALKQVAVAQEAKDAKVSDRERIEIELNSLPISDGTRAGMLEMNIDPERLAASKQVEVHALTEEDCSGAVQRKRAFIQSRKAKKADEMKASMVAEFSETAEKEIAEARKNMEEALGNTK